MLDDDEWVAIGALQDDSDYYRRFEELFDLDIAPRCTITRSVRGPNGQGRGRTTISSS